MSRVESSEQQAQVLKVMRALGGEGTLGDILVLAGLPRQDVENALEEMIAVDRAQVRVSNSGELIYHLPERRMAHRPTPLQRLLGRTASERPPRDFAKARRVWLDRKTLRLIRARQGVISLAELVEHTGLPLKDAEKEMERLADCYGGQPLASWDGHIVHVFPELMASAHGRFGVREPRPAWVRAADPTRLTKRSLRRETAGLIVNGVGLVASVVAPWLLASRLVFEGPLGPLLAVVPSAAGALFFGHRLIRAFGQHRLFRFRRMRTLRRYALGHVVETALKGKGVVSLDRTVKYLQTRAGKRKVKRSAVEEALRELAREFDAPITELGGDLFFGFRNVKRQFLASDVVRRRLQLGRTAFGRTVYDSGDSPLQATQRDLESFDLELHRTG